MLATSRAFCLRQGGKTFSIRLILRLRRKIKRIKNGSSALPEPALSAVE
jgi:hypothetical protein